jgi:hypothetical protein
VGLHYRQIGIGPALKTLGLTTAKPPKKPKTKVEL